MSDFFFADVWQEEPEIRTIRKLVNEYFANKYYFRFGTYCKNKTGYRNKYGRFAK